MRRSHSGKIFRRRWYAVLVGLALLAVCLGRSGAQDGNRDVGQEYRRADAEIIDRVMREIVADPEFRPRKTFRQWLNERLRGWNGPGADIPEGVGTVIFTIVMIWCVLALLAILAHLIWTIWIWVRPARRASGATGALDSRSYDSASPQQLWERSRELARAGALHEAIGVLMLALLRHLAANKILNFHKSKTNGEYVAEYPHDLPGRREFAELVGTFERNIYGGLPVGLPMYEAMATAAERIIRDASQESPI